jgi:hypothetical protein
VRDARWRFDDVLARSADVPLTRTTNPALIANRRRLERQISGRSLAANGSVAR